MTDEGDDDIAAEIEGNMGLDPDKFRVPKEASDPVGTAING